MKKLMMMALMCLCVMGLASCGGSKSEKAEKPSEYKVKPEKTSITGALADCFEVVDKEYVMKKDMSAYVITLEVKRTDGMTPWYDSSDVEYFPNADKSSASTLAGFGIEILDKDGNVIYTHAASRSGDNWDAMASALRLNPGESGAISFRVYDMKGEPASFRITSDMKPNEEATAPVRASKDDDYETLKEANGTLDDVTKEAGDALDEVMNSEEMKQAKDIYNTASDLIEMEGELLKSAHELSKHL